jgi:hypothetical protein
VNDIFMPNSTEFTQRKQCVNCKFVVKFMLRKCCEILRHIPLKRSDREGFECAFIPWLFQFLKRTLITPN